MITILGEFKVKPLHDLIAREHYEQKFPEAKFAVISMGGMILAVTTTEKEAQEVINKVISIN